jgi:DNA-binding MarR family transcriptional regulator
MRTYATTRGCEPRLSAQILHGQARLRVMVTLATLRAGDSLSFTRLQELLGRTPGNLITHLRKLEDAGYVTTVKSGRGVTARTSVSLTEQGRRALGTYTRQSCGSCWTQPALTGRPGTIRPRRLVAVRKSNEAVL